MATKDSQASSPGSSDIQLENEIMKLKMQAEYGTQIFTNAELPPDLEAEFLNQVYAFEEAWKNVRLVRVYELIGSPPFVLETNVSDADLPAEVARLLFILREHHIHLDGTEGKDPRTVYRYITEVLFDEEVDDLKLEGLERHFYL